MEELHKDLSASGVNPLGDEVLREAVLRPVLDVAEPPPASPVSAGGAWQPAQVLANTAAPRSLGAAGSPSLTALITVVEGVPYLLFGLFSGALSDRLDRQRVMVVADVVAGLGEWTTYAVRVRSSDGAPGRLVASVRGRASARCRSVITGSSAACIDATGATIDAASCIGLTHLGNEMQVAVTGSLSASGVVKITSVKCEKVAEGSIVVTRQGKVGKVDTVAKTFAITTEKETITVSWSTATTFVDVDVATLGEKYVTVEATISATGLQARKVSLHK